MSHLKNHSPLFTALCLLFFAVLPARSATDPISSLTATNNLYEWARLSREIVKQGLTVSTNHADAFVRHQLVQLSTADYKQREAIKAQIVALGTNAAPSLITAITHAAKPAPIFGDSAVANISLFTMQILAQMKCSEAVPALIDFIDQYKTDYVITGPDGKPLNTVVQTLTAITGQNFGTDKAKWKQWHAGKQRDGK